MKLNVTEEEDVARAEAMDEEDGWNHLKQWDEWREAFEKEPKIDNWDEEQREKCMADWQDYRKRRGKDWGRNSEKRAEIRHRYDQKRAELREVWAQRDSSGLYTY